MSRAMKDSGIPWIGEIPQDWEVCSIKQVMKNKSVRNYPDENVLSLYRDYGVVPKDSRNDNHNVTSEDTSSYKFVEKGDFVLNKMKAWQGSMAVSDYQGIISPAYYICQFVKLDTVKRFIHYLLRNEAYKTEYMRLSTGLRIGQWDLNINDFLCIKMIYPKPREQQVIADFLDVKCAEVDELIALQEKMIDELKVYKQSVITEAVTKGLNPDVPLKDSGIEWIGQIPEHWSVERLKNRIHKSFAGIWGDDAQNNEKDVRCYRVADFDYNQLNISDDNPTKRNIEKSVFEQRKVLFNDILLEKSGGGEKSPVGRAVYVNLQEEAVCSNFVHCIRVNENSVSKFMVYIFSDMYSRKVNLLYFNQTTGIQNLNISDYLNNTVGFPPIEEQQQIADYLDTKCVEIDVMTSIKQQKIEQLKEYKKSIIYEYVTGKKQLNF